MFISGYWPLTGAELSLAKNILTFQRYARYAQKNWLDILETEKWFQTVSD